MFSAISRCFDFKIKIGSRRIVFLIGKRVYKIPKFTKWVSFIRGIEENLEERYWWSADGSRKYNPKKKWDSELLLAEIFFADSFGFLLIMERLDTSFFVNNQITLERLPQVLKDLKILKDWAKDFTFYVDIEPRNVGYRGDKLLMLDYGYFGGTMDCYIGT